MNTFHPATGQLFLLRWKGNFRSAWHFGLTTLGAATYFGIVFFLYLQFTDRVFDLSLQISFLREGGSLLVPLAVVFTANFFVSRRGIPLTIAEEHLLMPAPLQRRDLVAYLILQKFAVSVLAAVVAAVLISPAHIISAFLRLQPMILFAILFQSAVSAILQHAHERVFKVLRLLSLLPFVVAAGVLALTISALVFGRGKSAVVSLIYFFGNLAKQIPDYGFFSAITNPGISYAFSIFFVFWALSALCALICFSFLAFDSDDYLASNQKIRRMQQQMKGQGPAAEALQIRWSIIPHLPHWKGLGSLLWLQATEASRSLQQFALPLSLTLFFQSLLAWLSSYSLLKGKKEIGADIFWISGPAIAIGSIVFLDALRLIFQMERIKALPVRNSMLILSRILFPAAVGFTALIAGNYIGWALANISRGNAPYPGTLTDANWLALPFSLFAASFSFWFFLQVWFTAQKVMDGRNLFRKGAWLTLMAVPVISLAVPIKILVMLGLPLPRPTYYAVNCSAMLLFAAFFWAVATWLYGRIEVRRIS